MAGKRAVREYIAGLSNGDFQKRCCTWSACRMCSYRHERYPAESCDALLGHLRAQLAWVMNEYNPADYSMVKIFTSEVFLIPGKSPRSSSLMWLLCSWKTGNCRDPAGIYHE